MTPFDHVQGVPVRTPTLPPATHTNTWVLGQGDLTVVDPASPYEDEQARLFDALMTRVDAGETIARLFLTHHHLDHVSGAADLQHRLSLEGISAPIAAHPVTIDLLKNIVEVEESVVQGDVIDCGGVGFTAHHTPGHAPGHLVLHDPVSGAAVVGDMVAGVGTIAIDPREGDLQDYLDSLEMVRGLGASQLLPAHGPAMPHADAVIRFYVAHRHSRSEQIHQALQRLGSASALELVPEIYPDLDVAAHLVAMAQIFTHLRWLSDQGLVIGSATGAWQPTP